MAHELHFFGSSLCRSRGQSTLTHGERSGPGLISTETELFRLTCRLAHMSAQGQKRTLPLPRVHALITVVSESGRSFLRTPKTGPPPHEISDAVSAGMPVYWGAQSR